MTERTGSASSAWAADSSSARTSSVVALPSASAPGSPSRRPASRNTDRRWSRTSPCIGLARRCCEARTTVSTGTPRRFMSNSIECEAPSPDQP